MQVAAFSRRCRWLPCDPLALRYVRGPARSYSVR